MEGSIWYSAYSALLAGLLSFLAPCVLPLVPAYLSYMTGVSVDQLRGEGEGEKAGPSAATRATLHSIAFVLGFSLVFILLGASATALGKLFQQYAGIMGKVGGVIIIIMGLHYVGLFRIGFLNMSAQMELGDKPKGLAGSFVMGFAFGFGWTPCVGPILGTILGLASQQETVMQGVFLLAVYSAGLGLPFILAGLAINRFFDFFTHFRRHLHKVEVTAGVLLILIGVLIFMGDLTLISVYLMEWFPWMAELG